jgi:hypothetical protein
MGWVKDAVDLLKAPAHGAYSWWKAPSLEITFNPEEPWVGAVANAGGQQGWFYRLDVTNKGRSVAECCVATLLTVEPVAGSGQKLGKPCVLKWAHGATFSPIDIDASDPPRKLDLFYLLQHDQRLHFFVDIPPIPLGFSNVFPLAEYHVRVRVKANSGHGVERRFRLAPGTNPGEVKVLKLKE